MNKKADIPGWVYIIGLVIGLFVVAFVIWMAWKSGKMQIDLLGKI